MMAVYEHTAYLCGREKFLLLYLTFRCITYKKVSKPAKELADEEITVDLILLVALP